MGNIRCTAGNDFCIAGEQLLHSGAERGNEKKFRCATGTTLVLWEAIDIMGSMRCTTGNSFFHCREQLLQYGEPVGKSLYDGEPLLYLRSQLLH